MRDPVLALFIVGLATAVAILLFWPVRGLFWRLTRGLRLSERVLIEDALKHVYDCEYRQVPCTLHSIAGALGLPGKRVVGLVGRLEQMKLIERAEEHLSLTAEGRRDAMRVIRIHRLWERYFSDRTGLEAGRWHAEAELREHKTTAEQAEKLAASLGHPRFDPHGDPIPTEAGEVVPVEGVPLTHLPIGEWAGIVHVEDEPEAAYAVLVAMNLHPGMRVRVLEQSPGRILFEADGQEHVLAAVVAANVTVATLPKEERVGGPFERLSALKPGESASVVGLAPACRGPERRRMLDLGLVPGTLVQAEMTSPGGDPTAYRVRGAVIALRREQADLIHVRRTLQGAA